MDVSPAEEHGGLVVSIKLLEDRAISPQAVRPDGVLTSPRSYGAYELPEAETGTRRFRYGNHPVRLQELEGAFGACKLLYLFLHRDDAAAMAAQLNGLER